MEVNFKNLQDNIVYHSNIFNYDKQFLMSLLKNGIKINFSEYAQVKNVKSEDINKAIEFLKLKAKDQVELMSFVTYKEFQEYGYLEDDIFINEELAQKKGHVAKTLYHLFNLFNYSLERAEEYAKSEEIDSIKAGEFNADNLIGCLLFFDGISMANIDVIKLIENNAFNISLSFEEFIFNILNHESFDFHIKEIASHLLSIDLMNNDRTFNDAEINNKILENSKKLMNWTYELCIQKQRDSCLTSNLSLLLTIDDNIDYFLEEFNKESSCIRKLFELMTEPDININIIYESLLCMWNISSNKKNFYFFENKEKKYIEKIIQVIRTNKIDKVARIGLMTIKNLMDSQICVEILFDIKFMQTVSILLTNKWNDPIIKELLNYTFDYLEKNYKSMNSFDKYMKEIDSGKIKKGSLHSREFWEENYKEFEFSNFEYIRRLVRFVQNNSIEDEQIEQQCIACFDLGEFARLYPGGASILEYFGAKDCLLRLIQHKNMELKNRALVCLQKIMMKSLKK